MKLLKVNLNPYSQVPQNNELAPLPKTTVQNLTPNSKDYNQRLIKRNASATTT
jgi:hypothetical protein